MGNPRTYARPATTPHLGRQPDLEPDPYERAQKRRAKTDANTARRLRDGFAMLNGEGIIDEQDDD